MKKIAIFASGNGSNFEALVKGAKKYEVSFLFCDRKDAFVIERAKKLNIPVRYASIIVEKDKFEEKILSFLKEFNVDLIVLAGYMKLIKRKILNKYKNKIINIHPSLLPKYPGANAIEQAFMANEKEFGITIHFVDEGMDTGQIIFQKSFSKSKNDSLEDTENKVHILEHKYYPKFINKLSK